MSKKTLYLTLSKKPFEVMVTGEKQTEFRKPSDWIKSRIFNKDGTLKHYDEVQFKNGYHAHNPSFKAVYKGAFFSFKKYSVNYSNGLSVDVEIGDLLINIKNL